MPPKRKRQAATPDRTLRSSTRRAVIETNTFTQPSHTISQDSSAPITTQQTSSAEQPINSNSNTSSVDILNQLLARVESLSQEVQSLRQRNIPIITTTALEQIDTLEYQTFLSN